MAKILAFDGKQPDEPNNILRKVQGRPKNTTVRSREFLAVNEVGALMTAAGNTGRHQHRDRTLILTMFRHGLRVSEAVDLKWDQISFKAGSIHVNRLKNGKSATHYLEGDEIRALRRLTIQDYLGHVSITHTVRYTELSPHKFKGLWS